MASITDIDGVLLGHWQDTKAKTGCTAIVFEEGVVAGVDVRGAAPGTRETDLLCGYHLVDRIDGIMLCGGSAFGLDAAGGAMRFFEEKGRGFASGPNIVPIVPAAVLYDLEVGDSKVRPNAQNGYEACQNARRDGLSQGNIGAGTGASVGKLLGIDHAMPGGIGSACIELAQGIKVAAIMAVNALGDVFNPHTGEQLAGPRNQDGTMISTVDYLLHKEQNLPTGNNTTIGVIVTNADLTREQANRMASMGHDGLALSIRPVHTPFDGDTIFAASTQKISLTPEMLPMLFIAATQAAAQAVVNAFIPNKGTV